MMGRLKAVHIPRLRGLNSFDEMGRFFDVSRTIFIPTWRMSRDLALAQMSQILEFS